ncbi:MAG: electron transfer flavoprotein subunit beta/FixA family protein [Thermincolia bacterium]
MNVIVCLKQTFDTEAKITLDDNGQINSQGVNLIMNPYDEIAVEEALRIKEAKGGQVTVISMGAEKAEEALRQALAMGADKAVLLTGPELLGGDEFTVANALAKAIRGMEYDLILCGFKAIDNGASQVAGRVAESLGLPQVTVVTKLEVAEGKALAHREIEGGTEVVEVSLPALLTAQRGLNEPRYPSMKGIMQAKKKELIRLGAAELGLEPGTAGTAGAKSKVVSYHLPPARSAGKILNDGAAEAVAQLVQLLHKEAKVV